MSRGDFGAGGGYQQSYGGGGYGQSEKNGDTEYMRIANNASSNIQQLTRKIALIQKLVNQIGTPQDVPENFERLQSEQKDSNLLVKETSSLLQKLGNFQTNDPGEMRQRKIQQDKLHENFSNALNNFQKVQRLAADKERESLQRARAQSVEFRGGNDSFGDDNSRMYDNQPQLQRQTEAELSLDEIREREAAIRQLESDIVDVNEIFKDLAIMVHEQGETIDSIEANVDTAVSAVEAGNVHLHKARDYQKKSRRKMCILILILLIVVVVLGLIIYFSVK
ncbi:syntaxin-7-like [Clytia hemisphaerica]|uniref:t-SNARE coiled-coil homology domain-containing protein n=1 Tax=Clytia hemisphaerica TaxID=252671 RepID=A0A7M5TWF3_9CNID